MSHLCASSGNALGCWWWCQTGEKQNHGRKGKSRGEVAACQQKMSQEHRHRPRLRDYFAGSLTWPELHQKSGNSPDECPGQMRFCLKPPEPAAGSSAGWGGKAQRLLLCTARKSSLLPAAPRAARPQVKRHRSAAGTARGHAQQHTHCPGAVSPLCIVGQCRGLAVAVINRRKTEPQEKGQKLQGVCCLSAENQSGVPM